MCAHAALLALSEEPCQYVRNWVIRVSDLQSTGPAPERIPATDSKDKYVWYPGRLEKQRQTRSSEDNAAAAEGLSSGLVRLFHRHRRVFDSKETTNRGSPNSVRSYNQALTIEYLFASRW